MLAGLVLLIDADKINSKNKKNSLVKECQTFTEIVPIDKTDVLKTSFFQF